MNRRWMFAAFCLPLVFAGSARSQVGREDPEFLKKSPAIGEAIPALTVYTSDGKEFSTLNLRGHYTVLAFGCLT